MSGGGAASLLVRLGMWLGLALLVAFSFWRVGSAGIGEFASVYGQIQRAELSAQDDWERQEAGDSIGIGDVIRSFQNSGATIRLQSGGVLRMGQDSLMRFLASGGAEPGAVQVLAGEAVLEAGAEALSIGDVVVEPGARVQVSAGHEAVEVRLLRGGASLRRGEHRQALRLGEVRRVSRDLRLESGPSLSERDSVAEVQEVELAAGAEPRDVDSSETEEAATVNLLGSDIELRAGVSTTIHDLTGRVRVRLSLAGLCAQGGVVTLSGEADVRYGSPDGSSATVDLQPGENEYRVHCRGSQHVDAVARGSLRLMTDSGTRGVAGRAPRSRVSADGRRYRVVSQGRRAAVTFTWPGAPEARFYTLVLEEMGGRVRRFRRTRPAVTVSGGQTSSTVYSWRFEAGTQRSPTTWTRVTVERPQYGFALRLPRAGQRVSGRVPVSGYAPSGARVVVNGQELPVNHGGSFRGHTTHRGPKPLAVVVQHPSLGHHIYLRRAGGA